MAKSQTEGYLDIIAKADVDGRSLTQSQLEEAEQRDSVRVTLLEEVAACAKPALETLGKALDALADDHNRGFGAVNNEKYLALRESLSALKATGKK